MIIDLIVRGIIGGLFSGAALGMTVALGGSVSGGAALAFTGFCILYVELVLGPRGRR